MDTKVRFITAIDNLQEMEDSAERLRRHLAETLIHAFGNAFTNLGNMWLPLNHNQVGMTITIIGESYFDDEEFADPQDKHQKIQDVIKALHEQTGMVIAELDGKVLYKQLPLIEEPDEDLQDVFASVQIHKA